MELVHKGIYLIKYLDDVHVARAEQSQSGKWIFDSFDFFVNVKDVTVLARVNLHDLTINTVEMENSGESNAQH